MLTNLFSLPLNNCCHGRIIAAVGESLLPCEDHRCRARAIAATRGPLLPREGHCCRARIIAAVQGSLLQCEDHCFSARIIVSLWGSLLPCEDRCGGRRCVRTAAVVAAAWGLLLWSPLRRQDCRACWYSIIHYTLLLKQCEFWTCVECV